MTTSRRPERPLSLQFGDDLAAADCSIFADRYAGATGLCMQRHRRVARRASTSSLDGRRRIAFAEWQRTVRDGLVARAQILRVQTRRSRRTSLRRHTQAWAAATVGARALDEAERARATLAEREAAHATATARVAQQLALKEEVREAAERRSIYRRGMLRGSEAADAAWARKLELIREQDVHASLVEMQKMRDLHAMQLLVAVKEARTATQNAASVTIRQHVAAAAARVAVSEAVASAEWQLLYDGKTKSGGRLERIFEDYVERSRRAAFYSWMLVVNKGRAGRVHAVRLLVKLACRRSLQLVFPMWLQFVEYARSWRSAAALADGFRRCRCQHNTFFELARIVRRMATLSRLAKQLQHNHGRWNLRCCINAWRGHASRSVRVLELSLCCNQRRVRAIVGLVFHRWFELTQAALTKLTRGWRRQRLVIAFTAWSITVDAAVGDRIVTRLLHPSDHYCHIAGLELNRCSETTPMIRNATSITEMIHVDDSPATTAIHTERRLLQRDPPTEQTEEQRSWIVLSDSDSDEESCASNASFATCTSSVSCMSAVACGRSLAGGLPRNSLADITNAHRAG